MPPVRQIKIEKPMTVNELVKKMSLSGVMGAGKLANAVDIIELMVKDKDCTVFLGLAGAMVPGGMREIIAALLKNRFVDVLVTTGANLTHDLIEALGHRHFQGKSDVDDAELEKKGIDRIYDSYMKNIVYESLEDFIIGLRDKLHDKKMSIKEFLWLIGEHIKDEHSILRACFKNKIPLFCPAISDSALGLNVYINLVQRGLIDMSAFDELKEIQDITWNAKRIGVIYLGGGVPKNYIQQAIQFTPKKPSGDYGADYGVQITMDRPEHGGSSGAPLKEGISWGKMKHKGKHVTLICDATIALPFVYAALVERFN